MCSYIPASVLGHPTQGVEAVSGQDDLFGNYHQMLHWQDVRDSSLFWGCLTFILKKLQWHLKYLHVYFWAGTLSDLNYLLPDVEPNREQEQMEKDNQSETEIN